ncbi:DUF4340 domain-containing protein [Pantanalinema rosaneae CENA516]|uniref:DUF4340 domain-containing protein n=1 Tax=Pantanalinema rosaneae TaxID=1620701 RepID=UPI003D6F0FFF
MKLQRTPLILLAIAVLFGGVVYLVESQRTAQPEATAEGQGQRLFGFEEGQVQALTLTTAQQTLTFNKVPADQAKSPAASPSPSPSPMATPLAVPTVWRMTAPEKTLANEAAIAFLVNLIATGKQQQTLTVPIARQAEFGLDKPLATIEVKLQDQQTHRLILGKPNFNRSGLYARIDPPPTPQENLALAIVPIEFETAVNRPLAEWRQSDRPAAAAQPTTSPTEPAIEGQNSDSAGEQSQEIDR